MWGLIAIVAIEPEFTRKNGVMASMSIARAHPESMEALASSKPSGTTD
jgi:hypothetical protein